MTRPIFDPHTITRRGWNLPAPGSVVGGKYQIGRTLGEGGMGAVFEVTHCVTHKRFAIKWLLGQDGEDGETVKRFIREAQIAGRINHPNVVEIYDTYHEDSGVFLVMELLDGESLATLLARRERLPVLEALGCMLGAMEGVAAAHAAGIVHRDIKPANIFLCASRPGLPPLPKVLDFGVSRLAANAGEALDLTTTRSGTVIGTPHYMAPEQMRAAKVDVRADVYALGITLYEVLSGVRPYDAASYPDLIVKIAAGAATPLGRLCPALPRELAAVVSRAMAAHPDARYASVEALMSALRPFAEDARRDQHAAHAAVATAGKFRRGLVMALGVLALGSIAAASWLTLRAPPLHESPRGQQAVPAPPAREPPPPADPVRAASPPALAAAPQQEAPPVAVEPAPQAKASPGANAKPLKRRSVTSRAPDAAPLPAAAPRAGSAAPSLERKPPSEQPPLWLERQGF